MNDSDRKSPAISRAGSRLGKSPGERVLSLLHKGHLKNAQALYDAELSDGDDKTDTLILKALLTLERGEPKEALRILKKRLGFTNPDADLLTAHGRTLLALGDQRRAEALFHRAVERDPHSCGSHYGLGCIYEAKGELSQALHHYREEFYRHTDLLANTLALVSVQRRILAEEHGIETRTFSELVNSHHQVALSEQRRQIERLLGNRAAGQFKSSPTPFMSLACDKCGTHLMADVLQGISGLRSNWQYHDPNEPMALRAPAAAPKGSFIAGNWFPNSALLEGMQERNEKAVLLYRDPRDQIVSGYFYCKKPHALIEDSGFARRIAAMDKEQAIDYLMSSWPHTMLVWLVLWMTFERPLYVCHFERMISEKPSVIGEVAEFLGYPCDEALKHRVAADTAFEKPSASLKIESLHGDFKRKGKAGDWRYHFTEGNVRRFKEIAGDILIALGYEQDLAWEADQKPHG
ncbi:MAG: sulfotransferase domain-containing protein [Magnetococcales bacterium]|nr:sulfotransferase domain-containing protein [Magnetococcales bacterium]